MEAARIAFRRSIRPLLGNVVGVGIFALPYAVAQTGLGVGVGAILVCGIASLVGFLMYADIALHTEGHARFVGLMRQYLGPLGALCAALAFFISVTGTLVAYILVGGSFAHVLFGPFIGGELLTYRLVFLAIGGVAMLGGLLSVTRIQRSIIAAYLVLMVLLIFFALPHVEMEHLTGYDPSSIFLPFGVALFAFNGLSAVPEMRDVLGRHKRLLPRALVVGLGFVTLLYILFTAVVVGVSGSATSQEALYGLAQVIGPWILVLGAAIGLCTVGTAFMTHGLVATNTLVYDYRVRYLVGWAFVVLIPLSVVLFGSSDFVRVIHVTGGVGGGLVGLVVVAAYENMRRHPRVSKHLLVIPQWAVFAASLVFVGNIVFAFVDGW